MSTGRGGDRLTDDKPWTLKLEMVVVGSDVPQEARQRMGTAATAAAFAMLFAADNWDEFVAWTNARAPGVESFTEHDRQFMAADASLMHQLAEAVDPSPTPGSPGTDPS